MYKRSYYLFMLTLKNETKLCRDIKMKLFKLNEVLKENVYQSLFMTCIPFQFRILQNFATLKKNPQQLQNSAARIKQL